MTKDRYLHRPPIKYGPIYQLVDCFPCKEKVCRFESCWVHQEVVGRIRLEAYRSYICAYSFNNKHFTYIEACERGLISWS